MRFGNRRNKEELPQSLTLATMRVGWLVDYDLKTWEVTGFGTFDYQGEETVEWELRSEGAVHFLERSDDEGEIYWSFTREIGIDELEGDIAAIIRAEGEPPEKVSFAGLSYTSEGSEAGLYRENGEGQGEEFVTWSFAGAEDRVLYINHWDPGELSVYVGSYVDEYQFTDILPENSEGG